MSQTASGPVFLTVDEVLLLHRIAIEDSRGDITLRDRNLLESALAMPRQKFGDKFLHEDISAMGAAYAYHLCRNHPFIDGNKRVALASLICFLLRNGWFLRADLLQTERRILGVAEGTVGKEKLTEWVCSNIKPREKQD